MLIRSSMLEEHRAHVNSGNLHFCTLLKEFGALTKWLAGRVSCLSLNRLLYRGPPSTSNCCDTALYERLKAELHCHGVEGEWNPPVSVSAGIQLDRQSGTLGNGH
jgi:hypothetical protein